MPISANADRTVRTVAETIDYCPDFYHWQANVAGALSLLTKKLCVLALPIPKIKAPRLIY